MEIGVEQENKKKNRRKLSFLNVAIASHGSLSQKLACKLAILIFLKMTE